MKRTLHTIILLLLVSVTYAQGDEVSTAVEVLDEDSKTATEVLTATPSPSLFTPACVFSPTEDSFYFNTISALDNKITISMQTTVSVIATINYQIFKAIGGNTNNLEQLSCSSYEVTLATVAQGFTEEFSTNINEGDVFFLRVYKPTGITGPQLSTLLAGTILTMKSENAPTLSIPNIEKPEVKLITKKKSIELFNNLDFKEFAIFSLEGKKINSNKSSQLLNNIDISSLKQGVYVLILNNNKTQKVIKFIKK